MMYCRILHAAAFVRAWLASNRKVRPTISEDDDSSEASDPTNPANITDGEDSDSDRPSKAASWLDSPCSWVCCVGCAGFGLADVAIPVYVRSLALGICAPSTHNPSNRPSPDTLHQPVKS